MKGKHTKKMSDKEKTHFRSFGRPRDSVRKTKKLTEDDKKAREEKRDELNFCVQNVHSMHSEQKESLVQLGIAESRADVIILTETWLGENSNPFSAPGYNVIAQKDRKKGAGGIMILTKTALKVQEAEAVDVVEEIQVAHFKFQDLLVIGLYRSPTILTKSAREHHEKLINYLNQKIQDHKGSPFVLTGDFNLGDLAKWDFNPPNLSPIEEGKEPSINQMWSEWFNQNDLEQYVDTPTFESSDNILDLVLTPKSQDVKHLKVTGRTFGPTFDHLTLLFGLRLDYDTKEVPRTRRKPTPETWKKYMQDIIGKKIYDCKAVYENAVRNQNYAPEGFDTAEDCIDEYITNSIREAYEEATPEVIVNPPPPEGYLHRDTVRLIRKSKRSYQQLKNQSDLRWVAVNGRWSQERLEKAKKDLKLIKKGGSFQNEK